MLYLKPANFDDIEKEYAFVAAEPADENGFTNDFAGISFEAFKAVALPRMIDWAQGKNLPEGFVPETFYFLWSDEGQADCALHKIVGELRLRHHLVPALENGSGHVGQFIKREFRGKGYCTEGLRLLIEEAHKIVPEDELYLHCNADNMASLRVMLKNGGTIHHKDENGVFVRIKLR
ncbi:MAG: GNAT family N-acetyltransferase [Spirochaetaceae bacterium]|nr:GNAT family N-acetyltransferase [Spirochaetaceae bacterium]